MSDQLQCKQHLLSLQPRIKSWQQIITPLYYQFVPAQIRNRRNVRQAKLSDIELLALLCYQTELGITNQRRYYRFLSSLHCLNLPERSRFNRLSNRGWQLLQLMRSGLVKQVSKNTHYTIIDSLPLPVCQPIRNYRARIFRGQADIGYNATKHLHYYGFKGSFEVTDQGLVAAYTVTKASIHDSRMVTTLIQQASCPQILADLGYLSQQLKQQLALQGINLWTPKRQNMRPDSQVNTQLLKRLRHQIETVFSSWNNLFDIERNRARSLAGFQTRLEQCLFVDTIKKIN